MAGVAAAAGRRERAETLGDELATLAATRPRRWPAGSTCSRWYGDLLDVDCAVDAVLGCCRPAGNLEEAA